VRRRNTPECPPDLKIEKIELLMDGWRGGWLVEGTRRDPSAYDRRTGHSTASGPLFAGERPSELSPRGRASSTRRWRFILQNLCYDQTRSHCPSLPPRAISH